MSRVRVVALMLIAGICAMYPRAAFAESDLISWFEELSGPGPFHSKYPFINGIGIRVVCGSKSEGGVHGYWEKYGSDPDNARPCLESTKDVSWYIEVHYSYATTGDKSQFGIGSPRAIYAHTIDTFVRLRVNAAVDLGAGIGGTYFTDGRGAGGFNAIGNWTFTPVSLVVRPAQLLRDNKWTRSFGVTYSQAVRTSTITSADFGSLQGLYSSGTELNARTTIFWDFGPFFFSKK